MPVRICLALLSQSLLLLLSALSCATVLEPVWYTVWYDDQDHIFQSTQVFLLDTANVHRNGNVVQVWVKLIHGDGARAFNAKVQADPRTPTEQTAAAVSDAAQAVDGKVSAMEVDCARDLFRYPEENPHPWKMIRPGSTGAKVERLLCR